MRKGIGVTLIKLIHFAVSYSKPATGLQVDHILILFLVCFPLETLFIPCISNQFYGFPSKDGKK